MFQKRMKTGFLISKLASNTGNRGEKLFEKNFRIKIKIKKK